MRNRGKKFEWNEKAQEAFEKIKRELCEAPVLGMPTKKGMYVLDTDASVIAISGILNQEQEWNESESKLSWIWGKAMTDCLARPEQ